MSDFNEMDFGGTYEHARVVSASTTARSSYAEGPARAFYNATAGNVTLTLVGEVADADVNVVFTAVPVGAIIPLRHKRLHAHSGGSTTSCALW